MDDSANIIILYTKISLSDDPFSRLNLINSLQLAYLCCSTLILTEKAIYRQTVV